MTLKIAKEAKLKAQILNVIFRHVEPERCVVFLFGSFSDGKIYPSSDIDVGIVADGSVTNTALVRIKNDMANVKTLRDIDVVDFSCAEDARFLKSALREVRIWHQTRTSEVYFRNLKKLSEG